MGIVRRRQTARELLVDRVSRYTGISKEQLVDDFDLTKHFDKVRKLAVGIYGKEIVQKHRRFKLSDLERQIEIG